MSDYRGRLAPSPTGYLHLGHARTFLTAAERAREHFGTLVLRSEDLDRSRVREEFARAMIEDLRWLGIEWQEGPDCGGPFAPYVQSERVALYREAFEKLRERGSVYACICSRQDVLRAASAPHAEDDEPIYPGTCRHLSEPPQGRKLCWRFRVPDGRTVEFVDGSFGLQSLTCGHDFGDFVVWRQDDLPAYQLAVVVDDTAMRISEVVRGSDLLRSTARQLLLYEALGLRVPAFFHCPLITDEHGARLAKRHDALSLRALRARGVTPEQIRTSGDALSSE